MVMPVGVVIEEDKDAAYHDDDDGDDADDDGDDGEDVGGNYAPGRQSWIATLATSTGEGTGGGLSSKSSSLVIRITIVCHQNHRCIQSWPSLPRTEYVRWEREHDAYYPRDTYRYHYY